MSPASIFEVELGPADLLYIPRGWVFTADAAEGPAAAAGGGGASCLELRADTATFSFGRFTASMLDLLPK